MRLERSIPAEALDAIRAPFLEQGAQAIDTPVLQPLNLLLDLAGEAMRPRLFVVQADGIDEKRWPSFVSALTDLESSEVIRAR